MSEPRDGEYIPLWWDADEAPPEYVRGHVTAEVAIAAINAENEDALDAKQVQLVHTWASWQFPSSHDRANGLKRVLVEHHGPGAGRFTVTKIERSSH